MSTVWAIPNTTITVLNSSAVDVWTGLSTESISVSGVAASIIEQSRAVADPVSGEPSTVRSITARVPSGTTITKSDRILDETTNRTYAVISVRQHTNPLYTSDVTLELRRTDDVDP